MKSPEPPKGKQKRPGSSPGRPGISLIFGVILKAPTVRDLKDLNQRVLQAPPR